MENESALGNPKDSEPADPRLQLYPSLDLPQRRKDSYTADHLGLGLPIADQLDVSLLALPIPVRLPADVHAARADVNCRPLYRPPRFPGGASPSMRSSTWRLAT